MNLVEKFWAENNKQVYITIVKLISSQFEFRTRKESNINLKYQNQTYIIYIIYKTNFCVFRWKINFTNN